jgi:hypothetical protein
MPCRRPAGLILALLAGGFVACSEDAPVSPNANRQPANALLDRVSSYGAEVPLAYYELSLAFTKQTAGFTPPVQSRAYPRPWESRTTGHWSPMLHSRK